MRFSSAMSTRMYSTFFGTSQPEQLLDGHDVGEVVGDGGQVVGAVGERDDLLVGAVLEELLQAAVDVADVRHQVLHHLAVHRDHDAEHAVGAGCCGPTFSRNSSESPEADGRGVITVAPAGTCPAQKLVHHGTSGRRMMLGCVKSFRSGYPSRSSGRRSRRGSGWPSKTMPNSSAVSRSCHSAVRKMSDTVGMLRPVPRQLHANDHGRARLVGEEPVDDLQRGLRRPVDGRHEHQEIESQPVAEKEHVLPHGPRIYCHAGCGVHGPCSRPGYRARRAARVSSARSCRGVRCRRSRRRCLHRLRRGSAPAGSSARAAAPRAAADSRGCRRPRARSPPRRARSCRSRTRTARPEIAQPPMATTYFGSGICS